MITGLSTITSESPCDIISPSVHEVTRFALYCAIQVAHNPKFVSWAVNWIKGKREPEKALEMEEILATRPDHEWDHYLAPCWGSLAAVKCPDKAHYYAACVGWRLFCDTAIPLEDIIGIIVRDRRPDYKCE